MKNLLLTSLVFALSLKIAFSQYIPLVEENKYWIFREYYDNDNPNVASGFLIKFEGDTLLNNYIYKKVIKQNLSGTHPCPPAQTPCYVFDIPYNPISVELVGYIREEVAGRTSFFISIGSIYCNSADEYELFNFSLSEGQFLDSCKVAALGNNPNYGKIDSITTEVIYLKNRMVLNTLGYVTYIGLPYEGKVKIIEGIGFEKFGLFHQESNRIELYDFCDGTLSECKILSGATSPAKKNPEFSVYPNPFDDILKVNAEKDIEKITIFDLKGEKVYQEKVGQSMTTVNLNSGVYIIQIVFEDGSYGISKIIKE